MQLLRYNPHKDVTRFERDLDKALSSVWQWPLPPVFQDSSMVDMYTEGGRLVVETMLPGFRKEEITIRVQANVMDINAEHQDSNENDSNRDYLLREGIRSYHRQVVLPDGVNGTDAEAEFVDSMLRITTPFDEHLKSKTLTIK